MRKIITGIYMIKNTINNKKYIGSSVNIAHRKCTHFRELCSGIHSNEHLQSAFNKYGKENFKLMLNRDSILKIR